MERLMVTVEVTHGDGFVERISTDDPQLLGSWMLYTAHKLPSDEKSLRGNWHVQGWSLTR